MLRSASREKDLPIAKVEAVQRGMGQSEAACSSGVSLSSAKHYAKMADEGKSLVPKKRHGSHPKFYLSPTGYVMRSSLVLTWADKKGSMPTMSEESAKAR